MKNLIKKLIPQLSLVLITLILVVQCSSDQNKKTAATYQTQATGDWYTQHRHMIFKEHKQSIVDVYNGPDGQSTQNYKINAIVRRASNIYMITMQPIDIHNRSFERMFVLSDNNQNMREFQGSHVIHWSRQPWPK